MVRAKTKCRLQQLPCANCHGELLTTDALTVIVLLRRLIRCIVANKLTTQRGKRITFTDSKVAQHSGGSRIFRGVTLGSGGSGMSCWLGCGEGYPPLGEGSGEAEKFFLTSARKMARFGAFWVLFL